MLVKRRAFTLIEVLIAVFMLSVAITAMIGALTGLTRAERGVAEKEFINRIAKEKLDEIVATQAWVSESGGSFDDERLSDYTWSIEEVNVGIENLTGIRLTISNVDKGDFSVSTIVYTAPAATGEGT